MTHEPRSPRSLQPASPGVWLVLAVGLAAMAVGGGLVAGVFSASPQRPSGPLAVGFEVPVTPMNLALAPSSNSPLLVAHPAEPAFVVLANRMDAPDFSCALHLSGDGGASWAETNPVPELPPGAEKCYAPEIAFDRAGVLHYLFVGLQGPGNEPMGAFLTTSEDQGRTFSEPRQVLGPLNFGVRMAIDRDIGATGRIHLVWIHARSDPPSGGFGPPPNPILSAYSDDGGRTLSEPVQVSDVDRQRVVAPALALGPDHSVNVAYYDLKDDAIDYQGLEGAIWGGTWSVLLSTSTNGGQAFGPSVVVDDAVSPPERVMLIFTMAPPSLVATDGRICLAWADARNGDADVLLRCSHDDGVTWSLPVRLNDDPVSNGKRQYLPRLAVAPTGRLDAIFYDRRADRENLLNHVYYTFSADGGKTFSPNTPLTRYPSNSQIGQQYTGPAAEGQFEFGNRLGLLAGTDGAVAAWADTRNHFPMTTGQDLFTATIALPSADGQPVATRLLGIALLAVGLLLVATALGRARVTTTAEAKPVATEHQS